MEDSLVRFVLYLFRWTSLVLILIVVEDSLVQFASRCNHWCYYRVLILIVVEDSLVLTNEADTELGDDMS